MSESSDQPSKRCGVEFSFAMLMVDLTQIVLARGVLALTQDNCGSPSTLTHYKSINSIMPNVNVKAEVIRRWMLTYVAAASLMHKRPTPVDSRDEQITIV